MFFSDHVKAMQASFLLNLIIHFQLYFSKTYELSNKRAVTSEHKTDPLSSRPCVSLLSLKLFNFTGMNFCVFFY